MKRLLQNRKFLYLLLVLLVVSVFTLSTAYAVLSTTLDITGSTEISASSWDIYLENVKVKEGSVEANTPEISGASSVSFNVDLTTPGDFYEFTVDVVNDGSIDAMIDSVVKTPELTTDQAKYIKYEITYENGVSINEKQVLKKETTTPIKVRIEYRKDLSASDLPSTITELSLGLTLVYIQSDGSGSEVKNNGVEYVRILSGDGTKMGDELCIKEECFYVISSTEDTVTMLAKYNLHVGYKIDENWHASSLENPTGKQDETAVGYSLDLENNVAIFPFIGTSQFSTDWVTGEKYSDYKGSIVEAHVNNYSNYLSTQGVTLIEARLISKEELVSLGCNESNSNCNEAPNWIASTSYWTGTAYDDNSVWRVDKRSNFGNYSCSNVQLFGVRPVITISRKYL